MIKPSSKPVKTLCPSGLKAKLQGIPETSLAISLISKRQRGPGAKAASVKIRCTSLGGLSIWAETKANAKAETVSLLSNEF